ncbi:hypothetical protein FKG94_03050 [Exilibacterium tricleocarpae]|uniref:Uncharacterized protein n=1 Tax=Exilibacterium tricleocarpae TaxID=2591008 RepID=A0A545U6S9_9GAMM|nr:hypothetical protein [Exilibacterium tricleocarpae]TQV85181.1 hypothetical protein FKG94_03050 [Exilibacterium tricleocarpae]
MRASDEIEQRHLDRLQSARQHSYDLTQRLTFYVISAELVICGYLLLNAEKFALVDYSKFLFLLSGIAAFFGLVWRAAYNEKYHMSTHYIENWKIKRLENIQLILYWLYVTSSAIFFVSMIVIGYMYLLKVSTIPMSSTETSIPQISQQRFKTMRSHNDRLSDQIKKLTGVMKIELTDMKTDSNKISSELSELRLRVDSLSKRVVEESQG